MRVYQDTDYCGHTIEQDTGFETHVIAPCGRPAPVTFAAVSGVDLNTVSNMVNGIKFSYTETRW